MADLVILNGSRAGAVFALPEIPTVLGRSPEAHLQIEDPWISSMHAMFERRADGVWVIDLESRNGTFLGDDRIAEARIEPGMVLRFGRTEVRVAEGERAAEPIEESPPERPRVESPTEPRPRAEARATLRGDAEPAISALRAGGADPNALTARPLTVLRLSIQATGRGRPADALAVRAALDAAARAAANEGAVTARLAASGVLGVFGMPAPGPKDPLHAIRAARTARAAVRAFGVALDVRAAVDRGPLLTGTLPVHDGTELVALGEAADRVERVLALAGPGETLGGPGVAGTEGLGPGMVLRLGREEILVFRDDGR